MSVIILKEKFNIVGNRYNMLTVVEFVGYDKNGNYKWTCKCDCGNYRDVVTRDLKNGHTKSCGCWRDIRLRLPEGEAAFNRVYNHYRKEASDSNRVFELTKEYFRELILSDCYYCGDPPSNVRKMPRVNGVLVYNGVDRIDNSIGYVLGNVRPCCKDCNFLKGFRSEGILLDKVKKIYHNLCLGEAQ